MKAVNKADRDEACCVCGAELWGCEPPCCSCGGTPCDEHARVYSDGPGEHCVCCMADIVGQRVAKDGGPS